MENLIEQFLASHLFADSTKAKYRALLPMLLDEPSLEELSAARILELINLPKWGNSQRSGTLYFFQKFLRWRYGFQHPALCAKIKRIKPKPRRSLTCVRALELLASFNTYEPRGARDLALCSYGLDTGFRREELCNSMISNIDFENNTAIALCKGGQWKYAAFSPQTNHLIQNWLIVRKPAQGVDNLFVSLHGGHALTGDGMGCIFKSWSKVLGFKISPHDLRSSFATLATIYGAPSRTVQLAGRWASIEMVEHYTGNLQLQAIRPFLPIPNLIKIHGSSTTH
jgi:integrase